MHDELCRFTLDDSRVRIQHLMVEGHPASAILGEAKQNQCDLIVIGTHGRTGLNRLLMGSVAEEVIRRAVCPVLTVHNDAVESPEAGARARTPAATVEPTATSFARPRTTARHCT
jgi:Universal stress protein family